MIKSEIVSDFVNRIPQDGVMMYEIYADISIHLDEYDYEDLRLFDDYYWCFAIHEDRQGELTLFVFTFNEEEKASKRFYNMIEEENNRRKENGKKLIKYNSDRIVFVKK